ncbi:uncharacterized protein LOC144565970 [Carex rostrata]
MISFHRSPFVVHSWNRTQNQKEAYFLVSVKVITKALASIKDLFSQELEVCSGESGNRCNVSTESGNKHFLSPSFTSCLYSSPSFISLLRLTPISQIQLQDLISPPLLHRCLQACLHSPSPHLAFTHILQEKNNRGFCSSPRDCFFSDRK